MHECFELRPSNTVNSKEIVPSAVFNNFMVVVLTRREGRNPVFFASVRLYEVDFPGLSLHTKNHMYILTKRIVINCSEHHSVASDPGLEIIKDDKGCVLRIKVESCSSYGPLTEIHLGDPQIFLKKGIPMNP